jgi:3-isopropylmalate/(R)-2-methylmalate dehydratase large subunit
LIYIDRHVLHDLHAPHAFGKLNKAGRSVRRTDLTFSMQDHSVSVLPGRTEETYAEGTAFVRAMREGSRKNGVRVFDLGDPDQGISHVVAPELGMILPGATHAVPDSHACTVGGLGALAFGCGTTELEHILATQVITLNRPKRLRVTLEGQLHPHVAGKDVALAIIAKLGVSGGRGFAIEFAGPVARALSVEARLTLCNLTIEMGSRSGLIAPDDTVFNWIAGRPFAPIGAQWDQALAQWRNLVSDEGAQFDHDVILDCSVLGPQITWGTEPSQVININGHAPDPSQVEPARREAVQRALTYMGLEPGAKLEGLPVGRVFIGSCTNSRLPDLEVAAHIVKGRKVAQGVTAWVVPGSSQVKRDAEAKGLDRIFTEAGFMWGEAGCSMCAGTNGDTAKPGERILSTTNRNFENRQGRAVRTHLVGPALAAAAAITGVITDVRKLEGL